MSVLAAVALGVAVLSACGSSSKTSSSPTTGGNAATTGNGGTAGTAATGSPILIGVAEPDQGPNSLGPEMGPGLTGGLYYVNSVLGGVHGHPIKTVMCNSDTTPSVEVNCANKFVSDGVVAVFDAYDSGFAAEHPILQRAGIPIFGVEAADNQDNDSSYDYFFGPPEEAFAVGPLQVFHQQGYNKITLTIANTPSSVQYVDEAINPVAKNLGMNVKVTYYDASAADFSVIASSLLSGNPQLTGIIAGPESDCTSLLEALRTDGFQGPLLMGSCSAYVKADSSGAVNTYSYSAGWLPSLASAAPAVVQNQIKAYNAAMAKTGNSNTDALGQWAVNSFSGLVDFRDSLQSSSAPYTTTSVAQALGKVTNYQSFMGPVENCTHQEWPGTASCNKDLLLVKVNQSGQYQSVEPGGFAALNPKLL
jgi:branched-chain amino acid transport system substrate-binding protein